MPDNNSRYNKYGAIGNTIIANGRPVNRNLPGFSAFQQQPAPVEFWGDQSEINPFGFSTGISSLMTDGTYQEATSSNTLFGDSLPSWGLGIKTQASAGAGSNENKTNVTINNVDAFNPVATGAKQTELGAIGNSMGMFASVLGQSIGNARSDKGSTANTMKGIGAGLGLASSFLSQGMNLFRTGASAESTTRRNNWVEQQAKKKLAQGREGQLTYGAAGGVVVNNETKIVPITGASGEFIAPKKGEANVEVEAGEVVKVPGDNVVKEVLGERHEDGGTPTQLPDKSEILSDRRTLTDKQAADIRDRFGIKVTPKTTFAEAQSKYKKKIGLSDAFDEMQKLTDKLEKNNKDIRDKNTARLNASVLSDRMTEVQKTIDSLSETDSQFFDLLFDYQQEDKRQELNDYYFGEGGVVDKDLFQKSIEEFGLTEQQAKDYWIDQAMKGEFAQGGRYMEFVPVYNKYRTEDETYGEQGYQPMIDGAYGRVSEWGADAIAEMARLFPRLTRGTNKVINVDGETASWVDPTNMTANAKAIESVVNGVYGGLNSLSDLIPNYTQARNQLMYGFSSPTEAGPVPQNSTEHAHNERTGEGKLGEYHMSRSAGGLRVVTPKQLKELNEKGIRTYSDLLENEAEGKRILGEDFKKLSELRNRKGATGLDFVIMDYVDTPPLKPNLGIDPKPFDMESITIDQKPIQTQIPKTKEEKIKKEKEKKQPSAGRSMAMPWLFGVDGGLPAPSPEDPSYLNQIRMMRAEPVLRSADQTLASIDQTVGAQLGGLNDLADSQRAAYTALIGAQANEAKARAVSEIDLFNAEQRNRASEINEQRYMQVDQINADLRERYEDKVLQGKAASEDAWFRYWQNMRDQQLVNDEARIKATILSNIYPDVGLFGNYTGQTNIAVGPNVKSAIQREQEELEAQQKTKRKSSSSSSSSTKKK